MNVWVVSWVIERLKTYCLRNKENSKKSMKSLEFMASPQPTTKSQILTVAVENCEISAVKHSSGIPIPSDTTRRIDVDSMSILL